MSRARFETETIDTRTLRLTPSDPLSFGDVLESWRGSSSFREDFMRPLIDLPFRAIRWELPPLTTSRLSRPFECVVLDSPGLDVPADGVPFRQHFEASSESILTFDNLGADAHLIVPSPEGDASAYAHLLAFLRGAPGEQRHALWRTVARVTASRLSEKPLWLSTAGGGVAWLHVRLDERPKYYGHKPYRSLDSGTS
ncbi:MAG: hypothetical protein RL885_22640 [Planctomycetota bacterium]